MGRSNNLLATQVTDLQAKKPTSNKDAGELLPFLFLKSVVPVASCFALKLTLLVRNHLIF